MKDRPICIYVRLYKFFEFIRQKLGKEGCIKEKVKYYLKVDIILRDLMRNCSRFPYFWSGRTLARRISLLPPGGPGSRSTVKPAACNILLTTPFAQ